MNYANYAAGATGGVLSFAAVVATMTKLDSKPTERARSVDYQDPPDLPRGDRSGTVRDVTVDGREQQLRIEVGGEVHDFGATGISGRPRVGDRVAIEWQPSNFGDGGWNLEFERDRPDGSVQRDRRTAAVIAGGTVAAAGAALLGGRAIGGTAGRALQVAGGAALALPLGMAALFPFALAYDNAGGPPLP